MTDAIFLAASFAIILAAALIFTNAVEWLGHRIGLGEGAVGSLLAAVGTAMPESLIPVVALVGGTAGGEDVAIGAIVGAPFLLATIAMFLVGVFAISFGSRRANGRDLNVHAPTLERDLLVFLAFFALALLMGLGTPIELRIGVAVLLLVAYGVYVRATIRGGGAVQDDDTLKPLILHPGSGEPPTSAIVFQLVIALGAIIGGSHLFVEELVSVAASIGVEVIVLSLVLAPLATELPEKANSFFWIRQGKDSLALGNITGAMVFQSMIPVSIGLAFTDWELDRFTQLSIGLGLAGGVLAYGTLHRQRRFTTPAIVGWGALYAVFVIFVVLNG